MSVQKPTFEALRDTNNSYTIVVDRVLNHTKSFEAFSLWVHILSKSPNWTVIREYLISRFGFCRRKLNQLLSYLRRSNLIRYKRHRNSDGTFERTEIEVLNGIDFDPNEPFIASDALNKSQNTVVRITTNGRKSSSLVSFNGQDSPHTGDPLPQEIVHNEYSNLNLQNLSNPQNYSTFNQSNNTDQSENRQLPNPNVYKNGIHWVGKRTSGLLYILKKQDSSFSDLSCLLNPVDKEKMTKLNTLKENSLKPLHDFIPEKQAIEVCAKKGLSLEKIKKKFLDYFLPKPFFQDAVESYIQKLFLNWVERERVNNIYQKPVNSPHSTVKYWDKNAEPENNPHIMPFGPGHPDYDLLMQPRKNVYIRPSKRPRIDDKGEGS